MESVDEIPCSPRSESFRKYSRARATSSHFWKPDRRHCDEPSNHRPSIAQSTPFAGHVYGGIYSDDPDFLDPGWRANFRHNLGADGSQNQDGSLTNVF